jgi:diguanylate cyclase (GGDEF)-like protein
VVLITGYPNVNSASEAVRMGAFDYLPKPVVQETLLRVARQALQHKALIDEKERYRTKLEMSIYELEIQNHELKLAEEAIRESEERLALATSATQIGMFDWNLTRDSILWTQAQETIFGYAPGNIATTSSTATIPTKHDYCRWTDRVHPEDLTLVEEEFRRCVQDRKQLEMQYRIIWPDGSLHWVETRGISLHDSDGKATRLLGVVMDITESKRAEEALSNSEKRYRELSIVDDLTQLCNSRQFYFQLQIEVDRSNRYEQPLTLLLLDLDNFKALNDAYGHVEGDKVLSRLGQVVKRCLRETDFAFRYGGEEFTVLLPMTTSMEGAATAERIRTEFKKEQFSPVEGQDVSLTVSIGLAQYMPQEDMKAFVHRVDQLMYQGKKNGKDRVCSEAQHQDQL